jgi:hypothetical protein
MTLDRDYEMTILMFHSLSDSVRTPQTKVETLLPSFLVHPLPFASSPLPGLLHKCFMLPSISFRFDPRGSSLFFLTGIRILPNTYIHTTRCAHRYPS